MAGVMQLPPDDFIKFNVDGSVFQTTRATLTMYDSALKAMASGDHAVSSALPNVWHKTPDKLV